MDSHGNQVMNTAKKSWLIHWCLKYETAGRIVILETRITILHPKQALKNNLFRRK